ncbi:MAG TPA: acetyl-CoA carboxylase biotin carboxyl carrier protein [Nitrospiria bacterium]|nr:acetyl-CoA carboxylase biotin carboxyl carrier protein [Nitrospiria bacterium]
MNLKEIRELIELMRQTGVSELEIERSGVRVRIRTGKAGSEEPTVTVVHPLSERMPQDMATAKPSIEPGAPPPAEEKGVLVRSPIVGTFYRSASPDGPNYVEVGDVVKKGQILCIVEAMKLMNEIESETDGRILEVLIENARPVEYGQPLFRIDPTPV